MNIKNKLLGVVIIAATFFIASCNKGLENFPDPTSTVVVPPTGNTLASYLATNSSYAMLDTALVATGLSNAVLNQPGSYTLFAPNNNAFKGLLNALFGIPLAAPDAVFIGALKNPAFTPSLTSILLYQMMITAKTTANFSTAFPNQLYPSKVPIDGTGAIRLNLFPSANTAGISYINNIPITAPDLFVGSNGIIHGTPAIAVPPSAVLKTMIAAEPTLSYFRAAIVRADSGAVGLSKFDSLLNYGLTNMTILAPNDAAFKSLIGALVYSNVFALTGDATIATAQAAGAVAAGPVFLSTNNVSTAQVKGIIAYHFLASLTTDPSVPYQPNIRAFSVNFSSTPSFVKTLVNNVVSSHPGIMAQASFTGPVPVVNALQFTGLGPLLTTTTVPFSGGAANAVSFDKHAVNGVYHIIDKVLLPQ